MEFKIHTFTGIILFITMLLIIISNYIKDGIRNKKEIITILITSLICIITIIYTIYSGSNPGIKTNYVQLFLMGIFTIASLGYTIYEWDTIDKDSSCDAIIPKSNNFNSGDYYVYRVIYLITLIILVLILQYKIDDLSFSFIEKKNLHKLLFLIPFILPILTEFFTWVTNTFTDPDINPESLLLNFIKGDNKGWGDQWSRSIMPFVFYIILMTLAILSSMGKIGTDGGKTAIYIIIIFLIFFSFIMRTLFVQDCSLDKNIDKSNKTKILQKWACAIEKYGGLQSMINVSLIIIIIYHINNPAYKLLFFIIIILGSWGLSATYILNLKK